ncbi:MAG: CsgG/HfaB family protein [Elusimicrobiota bacterium]
MSVKKSYFCLGILILHFCSSLHSADPLKELAKKLEKGLLCQSNKKIAILNFQYPDGGLSSGSSIVQERLTTFLVEGNQAEIIERNLLKKILEEIKFEASGVVDTKTTQEMGKLLGVGSIITGTLNDISSSKTEVNARVIETQTGKIIVAGQTNIKRTWKDMPVKPSVTTTSPASSTTTISSQGSFLGKPLIQIAILLDTSGSMDGLINQAKSQLWKIVNELSSAEKDKNNPTLYVALYEYGNDNLSSGKGYIRQILPFTMDLDKISENLFSLKTCGGEEYCGVVIEDAVNELRWDKHLDVYKVIFIAGNEPFTQGSVDFRESITVAAVSKGIIVNTIFCGKYQEGVATQWKAGADLGNGEYLNIDQEVQVVAITAPQDEEIQRLGSELNKTFIPYGSEGKKSLDIQIEQDKNVCKEEMKEAGAQVQRAMFKAKAQYNDASVSWDIVGQVESKNIKVEDIKKEGLPRELQNMNEKELSNCIQEKIDEKKKIQEKINKLSDARQKYIVQKEKEIASKGGNQTLDQVMLKAIRSQAIKKNFKFKN